MKSALRAEQHSHNTAHNTVLERMVSAWWALPTVWHLMSGIALLGIGLGYGGVGNDHWQYLLPAKKALNKGFLANDWFVSETTPYHLVFQQLAGWWLEWGLLELGLFAWHVITLGIMTWAVWRLVIHMGGGKSAFYITLGALLFGIREGWGNHLQIHGQGLPAFMGIALACATSSALFERRVWHVAIFAAATVYAHVNVGIWTLALALFLVIANPRQWFRLPHFWKATGILGMAGLPMAYWVLTRFSTGGAVPTYDILFFGRAPHHYAPWFSGTNVHLASIAVLIMAFVGAGWTKRARAARLTATFVAGIAAMGTFFLLVIPWALPVRMFPYRMFPVLIVMSHALMAVAVTTSPNSSARMRSTLWLVASASWSLHPTIGALIFCVGVFAPLATRFGWSLRHLQSRYVVAALVVLVLTLNIVKRPPKFRWGPPSKVAGLSYAAIAQATPPNALLLIPPELAGIRYQAERAVVVNTKCIPMAGPELAQWAARMDAVTGLDPTQARQWFPESDSRKINRIYRKAYDNQSYESLLRAANKFGADHLLLRQSSKAYETLRKRGFTNALDHERFALVRLRPSKDGSRDIGPTPTSHTQP